VFAVPKAPPHLVPRTLIKPDDPVPEVPAALDVSNADLRSLVGSTFPDKSDQLWYFCGSFLSQIVISPGPLHTSAEVAVCCMGFSFAVC